MAMKQLLQFISIFAAAYALPSVSNEIENCKVDAWVRAPDLKPNSIIQGDYRIRATGNGCNFAKASLVLRFDERSDLRYKKAEVILPQKPDLQRLRRIAEDAWELGSAGFFGYGHVISEKELAQLETFKQSMRNVSLWTSESIERTPFKAKWSLTFDAMNSSASFALIVPNVNYPPGVEFNSYGSGDDGQYSDSQHVYRYSVEIEHANGTTESVPAGYTSFHPSLSVPVGPERLIKLSQEVQRGRWACNGDACTMPPLPSCADKLSNFTASISLNSLVIQRGAHLIGNIRITSNGNEEGVINMQASLQYRSNRTWVYSMLPSYMNETTKERLARSGGFHYHKELFPQISDRRHLRERDRYEMANAKDSSWAFPFNVSLPDDAIPTFNLSFQSFSYRLIFRIQSVFLCDIDAESEDDEWEPRSVHHKSYHNLWTEVPIQVVTEAEQEAVPIHYLDDNAATPYFVSVSEFEKQKALSPAQRNVEAPLARPEINTKPRCPGTNHYQSKCAPWKAAYVGQTWHKKIKKADSSNEATPKFVVQTTNTKNAIS